MNATATKTTRQAIDEINTLATAIQSVVEAYIDGKVPVDSETFNALEEMASLIGSVGQYIATPEDDIAGMHIEAMTDYYTRRAAEINTEAKKIAARKAAQAAYDAAFKAEMEKN